MICYEPGSTGALCLREGSKEPAQDIVQVSKTRSIVSRKEKDTNFLLNRKDGIQLKYMSTDFQLPCRKKFNTKLFVMFRVLKNSKRFDPDMLLNTIIFHPRS